MPLDVTQNNVTNANSPGYAMQVPVFQSEDFQSGNGLSGGVEEQTQDARNQLADTAVQQQLSLHGPHQQLQTSLDTATNVFDVSSNSAIPSALNQLFQSFSQWSTQPSDAGYQTAVINAAQQTATAFQQAAAQLSSIQSSTAQDVQSTVAQINQDAAQIQATTPLSVARGSARTRAAQAQLESTLENLSG